MHEAATLDPAEPPMASTSLDMPRARSVVTALTAW